MIRGVQDMFSTTLWILPQKLSNGRFASIPLSDDVKLSVRAIEAVDNNDLGTRHRPRS